MSTWSAAVLAGAVISSPVYEDNRRGKNWLAVIEADPLMPGGVYRRWLPRARGEFRYMVNTLRPGAPVEFGADYVTTLGRKHPKRWYGVVRSVTDAAVEIEEVGTAVTAIFRSKELRGLLSQVGT